MLLRGELWRRGLRYRLEGGLFGKPDIVFRAAKIAVFVDGCFWHGCPEHSTKPKTNSQFWSAKIKKNMERDKFVSENLSSDGWRVVRIWEHEIKSNLVNCAASIEDLVRG